MATNVATTPSCRGHPEPRTRHRRGSRNETLKVRATQGELARWQRQASRCDLRLSDFVRAKLDDRPLRVTMTADPALLTELKRQGNNLNQLLAVIHSERRIVHPARVEEAIDALRTLYRREIARA